MPPDADPPKLSAEAVQWMRSRPDAIKARMRDWPPLSRVKTVEGVQLIVPAPGIEGRVNSYFENGHLGIAAKPRAWDVMQQRRRHGKDITEPVPDLLAAVVPPSDLEWVGPGENPDGVVFTHELMREILKVRVVELTQTCRACPSQWEGVTDTGRHVYIRYRGGRLDASEGADSEVAVWPERGDDGSWLYSDDHGDQYDGFMAESHMLHLLRKVLVFDS